MGAIWFDEGSLADHLHEIVGYKAGVAASIEHLCDLLTGTGHPDTILESEQGMIRLRSEDYEDLYFSILHKIGFTDRPFNPTVALFDFSNKLRDLGGEGFAQEILELYTSEHGRAVSDAIAKGLGTWSPEIMIAKARDKYGRKGLSAIVLALEFFENYKNLNPHAAGRFEEWADIENVEELFVRGGKAPTYGTFLDQRLINYLSVNHAKLGSIHWRKFEELIAECFSKEGYMVELGPGSNDDGVDIRLWLPEQETASPPEYLVQCKRQKDKIDKVTIKGLYADVEHENAKVGLLVTTSEFSPGAREVVSARGYPVSEVNGAMIAKWLRELRTPGTGIVRV